MYKITPTRVKFGSAIFNRKNKLFDFVLFSENLHVKAIVVYVNVYPCLCSTGCPGNSTPLFAPTVFFFSIYFAP